MGVYFLQWDAANLLIFLLKETSKRHAISAGYCTEKLRQGTAVDTSGNHPVPSLSSRVTRGYFCSVCTLASGYNRPVFPCPAQEGTWLAVCVGVRLRSYEVTAGMGEGGLGEA